MNNQYKPLPTPVGIPGTAAQPQVVSQYSKIEGTNVGPQQVGNVGIAGSQTFGTNKGGGESEG